MFDLPIETSSQQRNYRQFRKFLITQGFIMEQYSVYTKLVLNKSVANSLYKRIEQIVPIAGKIQMMTVTENQYADMVYLTGAKQTDVLNDTERITII